MSGRARRVNKRPLPLTLGPVAPTVARASSNQESVGNANVLGSGYKTTVADAYRNILAKLRLHLPEEVVFSDPLRKCFRSHVDLSGWLVTDDSLQQLQFHYDHLKHFVKSSFHTLTLDGTAHITKRGLNIILEAAQANGDTLRVLRLKDCQLLSFSGGQLLDSNNLPQFLTELDVSSCEWVNDNFLRILSRHCSSLTKLTLARCRRVTDYGIALFSESEVVSLTVLDISFCPKLTEVALLALLGGSSSSMAVPSGPPVTSSSTSARLRDLNAAGLSLVDGLTFIGLRKCSALHLETLNLSHCSGLRAAALQHLGRIHALTYIIKLDLSHCILVNDQILTALAEVCTQLTTLLLAYCTSITDYGIQRLVGDIVVAHADQPDQFEILCDLGGEDTAKKSRKNGCWLLEVLDITGCSQVTSRGIVALAARCPLLRSVTLDGVRRLDQSGVRALLDGCSELHTVRWRSTLVRNRPSEVYAPKTCAAFLSIPHLSEASLTALACSRLKVLHIGRTQCDTNALAIALLRMRTSPSFVNTLTDLDVTSLGTDALCVALGKCCTNLRKICLSRSRYFSATSFFEILRGCSRLRVIDIESCEQIGDETMTALSKAPCCSHLETLILANDWQLTDTGVAKLLRPATSLIRLDVRRCPEISLSVLQAMATARGHISEATRDGLSPRHPNVIAFLCREHKRQKAARKILRWLRYRLDACFSSTSFLECALVYFRRQKSAVVRVQRWYRRIAAQKLQCRLIAEAHCLRAERCNLNWAWIRALCTLSRRLRVFVRIFVAARESAAIQIAKQLQIQRNHAATVIQRFTRGWLGRRRAIEKRHEQEVHYQRQARAATAVQRTFRRYRSQKLTAQLRGESNKLMQSAMQLHCTCFVAGQHIQRIVRGFLGRQNAKCCKVAANEVLLVRNDRCKQIQRAFRAYMARVGFHNMMLYGAVALQKIYRGYCGRCLARVFVLYHAYASSPRILILTKYSIYTRKFAIAWARKRDAALVVAIMIQKRYRGFCGRREARYVLECKRQRCRLKDTCARIIQHFFRSIVILVQIARFRSLLRLRRSSATKIQATWWMWLGKVVASAQRLRLSRHRQHTAIMDAIGAQQQNRRLFLQLGAMHLIVSHYHASLAARGWQSSMRISLLHRSATKIQALVRGHIGRIYAYWFCYELARAASKIQRVWRGKQGKKMWRLLVDERHKLHQLQINNDRAAWFTKKRIAQHALFASEREAQYAVVLQRWFRTLEKRHIFLSIRDHQNREFHNRATTRMTELSDKLTGSITCQAQVWRKCLERKPELVGMKEEKCVALEKEIEKLKATCIEANIGSAQASRELTELLKRKHHVEHSCARRQRASKEVKQHIQLFTMRAKELTIESAHASNSSHQLQRELHRLNLKLQEFHANLQNCLSFEPLLMSNDVELLLNILNGDD
ncbi:F-box protein containing LRR [Plasmopara halstedii]|uniref:F-box protein containing LRR n=1 Tax=Plasmopara halstedii TaxID=4781 RepID=A0A0N7L3F2_PLAHL|nr:F-box protein containing LRR [Plasmopara halstedii]CEG35707.1 F-box protein containing LRR [Plasmopara halstedii]|eukprot:XP_024572076.1 F-box protein containing LRR [Plasmopara halstedii]